MQATLIFYIMIAVFTTIPLILFNVKRVFVKKPPEPMKINIVRGIVVLLICAFIIVFLISAYLTTLSERYEIALERVAQEHSEYLLGKQDKAAFMSFLKENGTENFKTSLDKVDFGDASVDAEIFFQISKECNPKYWSKKPEGFEQVKILSEDNPIYVMYLLDYNSNQFYYAVRMIKTDDGWKYDWIGEANEIQQKTIKMPTQKSGKWYTVEK